MFGCSVVRSSLVFIFPHSNHLAFDICEYSRSAGRERTSKSDYVIKLHSHHKYIIRRLPIIVFSCITRKMCGGHVFWNSLWRILFLAFYPKSWINPHCDSTVKIDSISMRCRHPRTHASKIPLHQGSWRGYYPSRTLKMPSKPIDLPNFLFTYFFFALSVRHWIVGDRKAYTLCRSSIIRLSVWNIYFHVRRSNINRRTHEKMSITDYYYVHSKNVYEASPHRSCAQQIGYDVVRRRQREKKNGKKRFSLSSSITNQHKYNRWPLLNVMSSLRDGPQSNITLSLQHPLAEHLKWQHRPKWKQLLLFIKRTPSRQFPNPIFVARPNKLTLLVTECYAKHEQR